MRLSLFGEKAGHNNKKEKKGNRQKDRKQEPHYLIHMEEGWRAWNSKGTDLFIKVEGFLS